MVDNGRDGLRERTLDFALRFIRLYAALSKSGEARLASLRDETDELTAIFVASVKTARKVREA